ncbi:MAG TPA: ATP-binding protein [Chitinophagaceae bacterium]|jgi:signal transduction histidine kinase|nr:ATP-binding protein [Chitinophagaceae bacterium]
MDTEEARIYYAVIAAVLVIGFIIGYFAVSVIRQQRRNLELQREIALAEISAMEKERARIATDLHDEVGPVLSTVKFRIDYAASIETEAKEELTIARKQLDDLSERMREVANSLMPSTLLRKGLIGAVQEFASNAAESSGTEIHFSASPDIHVNEEKGVNIYRIILEIVHNCLKHSKATLIEIIFTNKTNDLEILCRDNGVGFDIKSMTAATDGMGLRSIRNRTDIMGGKMVIESKTGKGTAFLFTIPMK